MSPEDMEIARRGYEAFDRAYRSGGIDDFVPVLEEFWDPAIVLVPAGVLPDSHPVEGLDGLLGIIEEQMQPFEKGTMWMEALEFIDAGDRVVVPYRFGGRARHTEIEVEFSFTAVVTMRQGKVVHMSVHESKERALDAAGVQGG